MLRFNKICEEDLQRIKWLNYISSKELFTRYRTRLKEMSNTLRFEKQKYVRNIMDDAELDFITRKIRDMYEYINDLTGEYKKKKTKDSSTTMIDNYE